MRRGGRGDGCASGSRGSDDEDGGVDAVSELGSEADEGTATTGAADATTGSA
jgi:hypothetical protein